MERKVNLHVQLLIIFVIVIIFFSTFSVEARKNHSKKSKAQKHQKQKNGHHAAPSPNYGNASTIFNVLTFGANGDGVTDDSKVHIYIMPIQVHIRVRAHTTHTYNIMCSTGQQALVAAWKAACKVQGATLQVPSNFKFLIKPITLKGPCMPLLLFQVRPSLSININLN